VYLVSGPKNVQVVLRSSGHLSSDEATLRTLPTLDSVSPKDVEVFKRDKTGRGKISLVKDFPEQDRVWHHSHQITMEGLASAAGAEAIGSKFSQLLMDVIEKRPKGQWETVQLWHHFIQKELVGAAITSIAGTKVLELNPGFVDALWQFDRIIFPLLFNVPKWMYRKAYTARESYHEMGEKWLKYAFGNIDPEKLEENGIDWEELLGSGYMRKLTNYCLRVRGFEWRSVAGMALGAIWA
jgi:hypothetical protein